LKENKCKIALITDDNIQKAYPELIKAIGAKVFTIPSGEIHKSRQTKEFLEDALFSQKFGKDSLIIAMGGGVVLDIAGFVAATFCRGIPLVLIPTTLLGMVDACLGGKTAINTSYGKNLIGSFYFPTHIIIDTDFLKSLPAKQLLNGTAEIIKYGLIRSRDLFKKLQTGIDVKELIAECLLIKKEIVESDPYENKGFRRILNFGHTIGHAIETLENYKIEHGEAIAIGMMIESYISMKLQFLDQDEFNQIATLLNRMQFPLKLSRRYNLEEMLSAFSKDKKALQSQSRFVILKTIGEVVPFEGAYCTPVDLKLIEEAINII
jgi:3-dehydroquinate synthase